MEENRRRTGSWKRHAARPELSASSNLSASARHPELGAYRLYAETGARLLFCDNETNTQRLFQHPNGNRFAKDGFHEFLVQGRPGAINTAPSARRIPY